MPVGVARLDLRGALGALRSSSQGHLDAGGQGQRYGLDALPFHGDVAVGIAEEEADLTSSSPLIPPTRVIGVTELSWAESYLGQVRASVGDDRTLLFVGGRGLVRDPQGRILLIKRADNGHWSLPAGAMELGESISDCAAREVFEETGLRATSLVPFALHTGARYTFTNMWRHTYQHIVLTCLIEDWEGELVRVTEETLDARFCAPDDVPGPASAMLDEVLADLAEFERTGRLVVK